MSFAQRSLAALAAVAVVSTAVVNDAAAIAAPAVAQPSDPALRAAVAETAELLKIAEGLGYSGVTLIAKGDDVLVRQAHGVLSEETGTPATPDAIIDIGSVTKQFTAVSILMLEQEGKLRTSDRLDKFLTGFPADKAALTIHQLLTHTSGLEGAHGGDHEAVAKAEALKRIGEQKLGFQPGADHSYSNSAYTLLAAIIEQASGRTYFDFVRERLFQPAGMTSTGFFNDPRLVSRPAFSGYWNDEARGVVTTFKGPYWTVIGNGEALSTIDYMAAWVRFLHGGRALSKAQLDTMRSAHWTPPRGAKWGYAMQIADTPLGRSVGHGGNGDGGSIEVSYFPAHDLTIVAYNNRTRVFEPEGGGPPRVVIPARRLRDSIIRIFARHLDPKPVSRAAASGARSRS